MMDKGYTKSTTIIALIQLSMILFGILSSGVARKLSFGGGEHAIMPPVPTFWYEKGLYLAAIPIIWLASTLWNRSKENSTDRSDNLFMLVGAIIIFGLFCFAVFGSFGYISFGCGYI